MGDAKRILALNSGSSSIKFAVYELGAAQRRLLSGVLEGLDGADSPVFRLRDAAGGVLVQEPLPRGGDDAARARFLSWLDEYLEREPLAGVGHRLVHGGADFTSPRLVEKKLLAALEKIIPFAPNHLPRELSLLKAIARRHPALPQVACFDTAFHRRLPQAAQIFPLPYRLKQQGILRYGFHGLSYEYIMNKLADEAGSEAAGGRVIIAHLGGGASMAAVKGGRCIDTTMGFTPAGGLMMGTRCGDLDPGLILFLLRREGLTVDGLERLLTRCSGLLGVSGTSAELRYLLKRQATDSRAALAIEMFCRQAKKFLGALIAVLGGLDVLVFTAGIGENVPGVRWRICEGLQQLGIHLDAARNEAGVAVISSADSPVSVRVMKTNEELIIARRTGELIQ